MGCLYSSEGSLSSERRSLSTLPLISATVQLARQRTTPALNASTGSLSSLMGTGRNTPVEISKAAGFVNE